MWYETAADPDTDLAVTAAQRALTERQKMLSGRPYDSVPLVRDLLRVRRLLHRFNQSPYPPDPEDPEAPVDPVGPERRSLLQEIFGIDESQAGKLLIEPPFFCDYGTNIEFGGVFYANTNCVVLDCAKIVIGNNTMFGPAVQIYGVTHKPEVEERRWDIGCPVTIGDDVWVGGGAIILGPCTIGSGSVIAAGSVSKVRGDVPEDVVVGGVPAKVLKKLERKKR